MSERSISLDFVSLHTFNCYSLSFPLYFPNFFSKGHSLDSVFKRKDDRDSVVVSDNSFYVSNKVIIEHKIFNIHECNLN